MAKGRSTFVVDASISAAWFLRDEATAETEAALHATAAGDVWVPALWVLETSNLLLAAERRKRITAEKRRELAMGVGALQSASTASGFRFPRSTSSHRAMR